MSNKKNKILVICASNNRNGNSVQGVEWFIEGIDTKKYEIDWIFLYDIVIPPFTNENRHADVDKDVNDKDIRYLIDKIESVDNIVISTPIWNFGLPSVLKSMIDRASCSGRIWCEKKKKKIPGWGGKRFYLIFTMGGGITSLLLNRFAIGQLYWVLRYFGASVSFIRFIFSCGNGSRCVILDRLKLKEKIIKSGRKYFH